MGSGGGKTGSTSSPKPVYQIPGRGLPKSVIAGKGQPTGAFGRTPQVQQQRQQPSYVSPFTGERVALPQGGVGTGTSRVGSSFYNPRQRAGRNESGDSEHGGSGISPSSGQTPAFGGGGFDWGRAWERTKSIGKGALGGYAMTGGSPLGAFAGGLVGAFKDPEKEKPATVYDEDIPIDEEEDDYSGGGGLLDEGYGYDSDDDDFLDD